MSIKTRELEGMNGGVMQCFSFFWLQGWLMERLATSQVLSCNVCITGTVLRHRRRKFAVNWESITDE